MPDTSSRPDVEWSSLLHGSFTLARTLAAGPERVFQAFADPALRRRWWGSNGNARHQLDFRIGGEEWLEGTLAPDGDRRTVDHRCRFLDILPNQRLVYSSVLRVDDELRSISLVTVALTPGEETTRLRYNEQYMFAGVTGDGREECAEREGRTRSQLDALAEMVERPV